MDFEEIDEFYKVMEENVLHVKIGTFEHKIDFCIESHFIAEDFSDDRFEKDVEVINSIKDRLLFIYYNNTEQLIRIITEGYNSIVPKLNLKWRLSFKWELKNYQLP